MNRHALTVLGLLCVGVVLASAIPAKGGIDVGDMPRFRLTTIDNEQLRSDQLEGAITVVEFWATWHEPCMDQLPHMVKVQNEHKKDGVVVIGVSSDDTVQPVRKVAKEYKIPYTLAMENAQSKRHWPDWGIDRIPEAFILSPAGEVLWRGHPDQIAKPLANTIAEFPDATIPGQRNTDDEGLTDEERAEATRHLNTVKKAGMSADFMSAFEALSQLPEGAAEDPDLIRQVRPMLFQFKQVDDAVNLGTGPTGRQLALARDPQLPKKKEAFRAASKAFPKGLANYRAMMAAKRVQRDVSTGPRGAAGGRPSSRDAERERAMAQDRAARARGSAFDRRPSATDDDREDEDDDERDDTPRIRAPADTATDDAGDSSSDMFDDSAPSHPAALRQVRAAERASERDDHVDAYRRYAKVMSRYRTSAEANIARKRTAEYEADAEFMEAYRAAEIDREAKSTLLLAQSYQQAGRNALARNKCKEIIEKFPDTDWARKAQALLDELSAE